MGMCQRRSAVDNISSRRVRERERPRSVLHGGVFQPERRIYRGRTGGPRIPGLIRIVINVCN